LVPCDEGELAKQQAKAEIRRAELEASMAQRREEAESRRQYEEALRADLAKHLPPGFSR
jgi:hypothetical protein